MTVLIHGKEYFTVAERLAMLQKDCKVYQLTTEMISNENNIIIFKATIKVDDKVATGWASETIGSNMINKTSALEVAETSAVGRALSFFGYAGSEIASADEVAQAIINQPKKADITTETKSTLPESNVYDDIANLCLANLLDINELQKLFGFDKNSSQTKLSAILSTIRTMVKSDNLKKKVGE